MNITISGAGYVGLVTAAGLAERGHNISCVEINTEKVDKLNRGICPFFEPGLEELMKKNSSRLYFTTDWSKAYRTADIIIIAVGTPEKSDGSANLKYVYKVVDQVLSSINNDCVLVIKSTVPIGTNDKILAYIDKKDLPVRIDVVSSPEFLSQGTAVNDMLYPNRIIVGADTEYAFDIMARVYENFDTEILKVDKRSAEMIKYAANNFLALKISYINEIANLCEKLGADVTYVAQGIGMDPRIGKHFLSAGIGYGGSCFPKDTKALHWLGNLNDYEIKTVKAAIEVNTNQKLKLIKKAKKYYSSFDKLTVAVLGLSFKPGTDDLRDAPSLDTIPILLEDGAIIKAWDPSATINYKKIYPEITYCDSINDALIGADICFIFTEWNEIRNLPPESFSVMKNPVIFDGRNCYSVDKMSGYSYIYESIGRTPVINLTLH